MEQPKDQHLKPILVHDQTDSNDEENKQGRKKSITWDEEGIEAHDKERNKIPKIDEPKTPFSGEIAESRVEEGSKDVDNIMDETTKENTLRNKHLASDIDVEALQKLIDKESESSESQREKDQERDEEDQEDKHKAFVEKRKQHYSEGKKLKEMLKPALKEDEEGEEDGKDRDDGKVERRNKAEVNKSNDDLEQNFTI